MGELRALNRLKPRRECNSVGKRTELGLRDGLLPANEQQKRTRMAARWLTAVCVATGFVSTAIAVSSPSAASGAVEISAKSLDVVGGPIAVGTTAVVVSVDRTHQLHLDAVDPVSDTVLWQHPYSASAITPDVALTPAAVGTTALDFAPALSPANPAVMIEGVNVSTGALEWRLPDPLVASDNPATCANNQDFCVTKLATIRTVNPSSQ